MPYYSEPIFLIYKIMMVAPLWQLFLNLESFGNPLKLSMGKGQFVVLSLFVFNFLYKKSDWLVQSCPTLCNPMDCSTPGFPIHHQLPELAQTHAHWVKSINSSVLSFLCSPTLTSIHDYWKKNIALTRWTFVGKVISLLFNTRSRSVITFLSRGEGLLI